MRPTRAHANAATARGSTESKSSSEKITVQSLSYVLQPNNEMSRRMFYGYAVSYINIFPCFNGCYMNYFFKRYKKKKKDFNCRVFVNCSGCQPITCTEAFYFLFL